MQTTHQSLETTSTSPFDAPDEIVNTPTRLLQAQRSSPMEGLTEGRIVHYVAYNGRHLAGIVIGYEGSQADLAVFTNMENAAGVKNFGTQFHQNVTFSTTPLPGTWHWIERV